MYSEQRKHNYLFVLMAFIPFALVGCEAPLNLESVDKETSQPIRRTDQLQAIASNDQAMIVVGNNGLVLTTAKGELQWQRHQLKNQPNLIDVESCPDQSFIALSFEKQIWRSNDNGQQWQLINLGTQENMLDLVCAPDGSYWVAGSFSSILSSHDAGASWKEFSFNEDAMLTSIQFVTPQVAYATGEFGMVVRSDDAGASWSLLEPLPNEFYPQATLFKSSVEGWVVGLDGVVMHTSNAGKHWQVQPTPVAAPLYGLHLSKAGLYALGENATVLQEQNGRWVSVTSPPVSAYLRAAETVGDQLLVAGGNGTLLALNSKKNNHSE
ncbi:WD40/YVTN/BNR-like repeat-containing protein [Neptunomonas japonica]|uniref:WD40/YVTN/BNR-like repeat-containing protein n=1 Tax=Neptunomonas japonica TaxID=417574 RepID=UPI0004084F30|nr:YCF48-related protein [Neptunomonas japonica]